MKGVYYLGVLRYLYIEKMDIDIKFVAGTSIGAFFAVALALKIPIDYLENRLMNVLSNIDLFNIDFSFNSLNQFVNNKGFFNLDIFMNIILDFLTQKGLNHDINFLDFVKKTGVSISISCTDIVEKKCKIFSIDDFPDVQIMKALRASMSIPFMFEPVNIDEHTYVDGVLSTQLHINNIFCDVPDYNKLYINITESKYDNPMPLPKGTYLSMYTYTIRTIGIAYKHAIKANCLNNTKTMLKTVDLPYKALEYIFEDKKIKFMLDENDYNSLVLHGFIDMTKYIHARFNSKSNSEMV
jgi:predicted patatin/cPLA2 family phospholipase